MAVDARYARLVIWWFSGMLFGWETIMTFVLVSVVYAVAIGEPSFGNMGPFAVGLALFAMVFAGDMLLLECLIAWVSSLSVFRPNTHACMIPKYSCIQNIVASCSFCSIRQTLDVSSFMQANHS